MSNTDITKIILGTGSYDSVKSGNTISISGDGGNSSGYHGPAYKKLAPRLITYTQYAKKYEQLLSLKSDISMLHQYLRFRKLIEDEYIQSYYETRLKELDVTDLLLTLKEKYGENLILLCYESVLDFCHRRLIADYIELKTGIYIPEVSASEDSVIKKIEPIRYKKRLEKVMTTNYY